jgi:hypothetical protein
LYPSRIPDPQKISILTLKKDKKNVFIGFKKYDPGCSPDPGSGSATRLFEVLRFIGSELSPSRIPDP